MSAVAYMVGGGVAIVLSIVSFTKASYLERPHGMWSGTMDELMSIRKNGGIQRTSPVAIIFGIIFLLVGMGLIGLFMASFFR